jgi:hypothetical protein
MRAAALLLAAILLAEPLAADAPPDRNAKRDDWWSPGMAFRWEGAVEYDNEFGRVRVLNAGPPIDTQTHPFFVPIGTNGRACVTCHQPANAMSVSVEMIQRRWEQTGGKDPLFAAIDGSNCPSLPQEKRESHSLLLERGLFRVFLPWPPRAPDGSTMSRSSRWRWCAIPPDAISIPSTD